MPQLLTPDQPTQVSQSNLAPGTPPIQDPQSTPTPTAGAATTSPTAPTGFQASTPTPVDASSVMASHDGTQDFSNYDYLKSAQDQIHQTAQALQSDQSAYNNMSQKYDQFANGQGASDVNFLNQQMGQYGIPDLMNQSADLDKQVAQLKATMSGTLNDVRQQFGGNAPESLIQATANTRNSILQKQLDSLTAQQASINAQLTNKRDIVDKLVSANEFDQNKQLTAIAAQTGIAKDNLSTGLSLYKDAVSTFNGDRSAARQATIQIISQSPFAAQSLAANPQAMQDIQNGMITPAVLGIIGKTYKDQLAQDKLAQIQIAEQNAQTTAQHDAVMAAIAQQNANTNAGRLQLSIDTGGLGSISKMNTAVKDIIANASGWGDAADQLDAQFGPGTATKYDKELKTAFQIPSDIVDLSQLGQPKDLDAWNRARDTFTQKHSYNVAAAQDAFDKKFPKPSAKTNPGPVQQFLDKLFPPKTQPPKKQA